jgi:hypothetical protein
MHRNPDIVAEIHMKPSSEGGRLGPTPSDYFSCPIEIDGECFDVRFDLSECGRIAPGETMRVPLNFLDAKRAKPHFSVGGSFLLREGRVIGSGRVLHVYPDA